MRDDKGGMRTAKKRPTEELAAPKATLWLLIAMEYFMGSNAKGPFKSSSKISGVAIATSVSGLLDAIAAL